MLSSTPSHYTSLNPLQIDVAGCVEHPVTVLPTRGATQATRISTEECHRMRHVVRAEWGLTRPPRIGPQGEQCHFREVKNPEGEEQQVVRNGLDDRMTPEHLLCLRRSKGGYIMTKSIEKIPHDQELPPLPDRAIQGLPNPWICPTGEPFHTVSLWEFTNLYVLLGKKDWLTLSKFLKGITLSVLSRRLKIGYGILSNIRDNYNQSIVVPNLRKLCEEAELDLTMVEKSIRGVRFSKGGDIEQLSFPFVMDIYAWRILCHIVGDGNIHKRKYPDLRWIQLPENQGPMREILERLSRPVGGESDQIWYPKALTYAIIGTMPGLTLYDLRSPQFLQFIIDLPPNYRDWKIQFLTAFIVDDGCISKDISFTQKDPTTLNHIMQLCDQLGYDHSKLYRNSRDGVHNFQLRQEGIQAFHNDLHKLNAKDPLLGLWHKHPNLISVASSFSMTRGYENRFSEETCITVISILGDHIIRDTETLSHHRELQPFLDGQPWYYVNRRLELLNANGFISEVKQPTGISYRPKHWKISSTHDPETLIRKFREFYNNRAHVQSYKRKSITVTMVKEAIARLEALGIKPRAKAIAREVGCSKKQLYVRKDLRRLFMDEDLS